MMTLIQALRLIPTVLYGGIALFGVWVSCMNVTRFDTALDLVMSMLFSVGTILIGAYLSWSEYEDWKEMNE